MYQWFSSYLSPKTCLELIWPNCPLSHYPASFLQCPFVWCSFVRGPFVRGLVVWVAFVRGPFVPVPICPGPFVRRLSKRTAKKNRCFGTCKPANASFYLQNFIKPHPTDQNLQCISVDFGRPLIFAQKSMTSLQLINAKTSRLIKQLHYYKIKSLCFFPPDIWHHITPLSVVFQQVTTKTTSLKLFIFLHLTTAWAL